MITEIKDLPGHALGFSLEGTITADDYHKVLIPAAETALKAGGKLRVLIVGGKDFKGYSPGAMWDDTGFGFRHFFDFERIAFVTDHETYATMLRAFGFVMPAMIRVFPLADLEAAKVWLAE
ncbi:STAS/SEC14 domain-containing protein [Bauldia sp.]|uniref:STAS/SEC14 domain-containing protein n=1 Tax=Bauldia sp. TaxID=2575872 RepID=UPI003BA8BE4D